MLVNLPQPTPVPVTLDPAKGVLVIVDMDSPDRDTLEDMQRITREQP